MVRSLKGQLFFAPRLAVSGELRQATCRFNRAETGGSNRDNPRITVHPPETAFPLGHVAVGPSHGVEAAFAAFHPQHEAHRMLLTGDRPGVWKLAMLLLP